MRDMLIRTKRIRDAAVREYIRMRVSGRARVVRRETDEEIRRELRAHMLVQEAAS